MLWSILTLCFLKQNILQIPSLSVSIDFQTQLTQPYCKTGGPFQFKDKEGKLQLEYHR